MHLYSLSLVRGGACAGAAYGNFSGEARAHEVVVARGAALELVSVGDGGLQSLGRFPVFGVVRVVATLRTSGAKKDLVLVGSDAGTLSVLEFDTEAKKLRKVYCEAFGKSGCRRTVPGQYVAVDPAGRAIMVAAVEMRKFVFTVTRDSAEKLIIASPLEAHKHNTLLFDCVALDVGLENPIFACLEVDYSEGPEGRKCVVLYEVEEGLNHVVRKSVRTTLRSANKLIAVPGGTDGPSGVLVCSENVMEYQPLAFPKKAEQKFLQAAIPKRNDAPETHGVLIVSHVTIHRKLKDRVVLFFLVQSEFGDLYKIDLDLTEDRQTLNGFRMKYFDTIPVAKALCLTKRGFLFLGAETGDHKLYKLDGKLGADDDTVTSSAELPAASTGNATQPAFQARPHKNIRFVDGIESLAPCTGFQVAEMFGEDRKQFYVACGRGSRSTLRILRHGLEVTQMADSELPGNPSGVWTVRDAENPESDRIIVISFANVTSVLSVGETVEEASGTGLETSQQTLNVKRLSNGSLLQVCPDGVFLIPNGTTMSSKCFTPQTGKRIECAALNGRQLAVALEGGRIHYLELAESGNMEEVSMLDVGEDVNSIEIGPLPKGRVRSNHLFIGTFSKQVRTYSLDPSQRMKQASIQALPDQPTSMCLVDMAVGHILAIGLRNGVLVRTRVDADSGQVLDSKTNVVGNLPVRCFSVSLPFQGKRQMGVLALSSRPFLGFVVRDQPKLLPLSYEMLLHACNFDSEVCDGFIAVAKGAENNKSYLRILSVEDLGKEFNAMSMQLRYTPRQLDAYRGFLFTLEGDHNVLPSENDGTEDMMQIGGGEDDEEDLKEEEIRAEKMVTVQQTGLMKAGPGNEGRWASLVRFVKTTDMMSSTVHHMRENEFALCACVLGDNLIVGTVTGLRFHPRSHMSSALRVFALNRDGKSVAMSHIHDTEIAQIDGMPRAICAFNQDFIAVGVSRVLRIYSMGKNAMLRKTELHCAQSTIAKIRVEGERLFVSDVSSSIIVLKFNTEDLTLSLVADDVVPRLSVACEILDGDTVSASDKMGNIYVMRLPEDLETAEVGGNLSNTSLWEQSRIEGNAPNKLNHLAQFYLGEVATELKKAFIVPGRVEALLYATIYGSIGCLIPFSLKSEIEFFSMLEMHLRSASELSLVGRDHLAFRSTFAPVKAVVDGDLCEQFAFLSPEKQKEIASELDRTPEEVIKRIEDLRNSVI